MSLILDAINRSREDVSPVPGLATHHPVDRIGVNRRQYLLWVALSVAVVVIAWFIVERYSAPRALEPSTPAPVVVQQPEAEQSTPVTAPLESSVPQVPVAQLTAASKPLPAVDEPSSAPTVSQGLSQTRTPSGSDSTQRLPAEAAKVAPVVPPVTMDSDAVAELYANPDLSEEPVVQQRAQPGTARPAIASAAKGHNDAALDIDKILHMAQEETENANLDSHPVPFLIDLSQQVKDAIPSLYYLRHDYSSTSVSTVVLNSKTLRVGDSPASGMKVEEILSDSVVLNYQGTQFRLRALNSWVNL